jgi:prephenate dehydrogenase
MWRDICLANREAIADMLGRYQKDLNNVLKLIEKGDDDALLELFRQSKSTRDKYVCS